MSRRTTPVEKPRTIASGETERIAALIAEKPFLDLACGRNKEKNAVGMDKRALPEVDIVHDIEVFPWPIPDNAFFRILASHFFEHVKPWLMNELMDECHRVMKPNGQLLLAMPYPGSPRFYQDPTHIKAWNEATPQYYDCRYPLWQIYQPKCWKIEMNQWNSSGDINIILSARPGTHEDHTKEPKD